MSTLVACRGLTGGYGPVDVIDDISLQVRAGEVVVLLGANGAGKSSTLRALAGTLPRVQGHLAVLDTIGPCSLYRRARRGLAFVPDNRGIFPELSVAQNLALAGKGAASRACQIAPELIRLRDRRAGLLSGGEQQILAVARALSREPRLLLADELSFGLAPAIVSRVLRSVREAADAGAGVLLVEQHVRAALSIADRGYVMHRGRIALAGSTKELRSRLDEIESIYVAGVKSPTLSDRP